MEHLLKWLDDVDDLFAVLRLQLGAAVVTVALLVLFLAVLGAVFIMAPPDLLAAP